MAQSEHDLQQQEIAVLKSIYDQDFIEVPPPTAWKNASRLPEFNIRIQHPDSPSISFLLNVKFPKTYPSVNPPIFSIEKPITGLSSDQVTKLTHAVHNEAKRKVGSEMVFEIVGYAQDWMATSVKPRAEVKGSLALQMNQRAEDAERARKMEEEERIARHMEEMRRREEELQRQIMQDMQSQIEARQVGRHRANSETTEVPDLSMETPMVTFDRPIKFEGMVFDTVKYFHPQSCLVGTLYAADPVLDDVNATLPLELFVVTFESHYYTTSPGRKKLKSLEKEIQQIATIRHPNVVSLVGVKLVLPQSSAPPQLFVLSEQCPALTLHDMLEDANPLKEDRAVDYVSQILTGLSAIHKVRDIVHRDINPKCIGLVTSSQFKRVRIAKVGWFKKLCDLHRSDPISPHITFEDVPLDEAWLPKELQNESSLVYTPRRDIHAVGIVFLQMLMGLDVTSRFGDVHTALAYSSISQSLRDVIVEMIDPEKKSHISCASILSNLKGVSIKSPEIQVPEGSPIPAPYSPEGSPETGYFTQAFSQASIAREKRAENRWREDFEELELLGRGGFGSVSKAKNKIDGTVYAVKKIRVLQNSEADWKRTQREVVALSKLTHPHIVRYYTCWLSSEDATSSVVSDTESSAATHTSVPTNNANDSDDDAFFNKDERALDLIDRMNSRSSAGDFPGIIFTRSKDSDSSGDSDDGKPENSMFSVLRSNARTPEPTQQRYLYIVMEFVERQTLKERIDEGISTDEAWRLFHQLVDALVHMQSLGMVHRDIKPHNIFIDNNGNCKIGDFGLATTALGVPDGSELITGGSTFMTEGVTLDVGTKLYIAPEVQHRRSGRPTSHSKADMYSLGVVFFEMNYVFNTGAERVAVIENLRKPNVVFPTTWDVELSNQKQIITWLLQHNPDDRPTALELSQSPLLPQRLEDQYFRSAMNMMIQRDSPHHETVLSSLFGQLLPPSRNYLYDHEDDEQLASADKIVQDRLASIFALHGAIDSEPPLLMPALNDDESQVRLLDRHGDVVGLPNNLIHPFARLAARMQVTRIKRYFMSNIYEPNGTMSHPRVKKTAVFDIITRDLSSGPVAGSAELVAVASRVLDSYPNLARQYEIHVTHSSIIAAATARIPESHRKEAIDTLRLHKSSVSQKRASLMKIGVLRSVCDELEILMEPYENVDVLMTRLEKISSPLVPEIRVALDKVKEVLDYVTATGVDKPVIIRPLLLAREYSHFEDGLVLGVVKKTKHSDILAFGGCYSHLITQYALLQPKSRHHKSVFACILQINLEEIKDTLAKFQRNSINTLVKDERSFGFWSPRRCDVYIVSQQAGFLRDRLDVVGELWQNNISADIMYEASLDEAENYMDMCAREGILFIMYPKHRGGRLHSFKVKSLLKGEDTEVSRLEIVAWLRQEIEEQKRIDMAKAGAPAFSSKYATPATKPATSSVQSVLPTLESKKARKVGKHIVSADRAFDTAERIRKTFAKPEGMPTIVVDVPPNVYDAMIRSPAWLNEEEAWRGLLQMFPGPGAYPTQIREALVQKREEGYPFVMLYASREHRMQLVQLADLR